MVEDTVDPVQKLDIKKAKVKIMANDLNRHECIGRLGQEVEIKYMPSGEAVANISVACGESWKDKNSGQKQERTTWVKYVAFGRLAEVMGEYLKKGSKVYLSGKLRERKWQDQSGQDRYTTEIIASEMQMLDSKGDNQAQPGQKPQQNRQQPAQQPQHQQSQKFQQPQPNQAHLQQQPQDQRYGNGVQQPQDSALQPEDFDGDIPF